MHIVGIHRFFRAGEVPGYHFCPGCPADLENFKPAGHCGTLFLKTWISIKMESNHMGLDDPASIIEVQQCVISVWSWRTCLHTVIVLPKQRKRRKPEECPARRLSVLE